MSTVEVIADVSVSIINAADDETLVVLSPDDVETITVGDQGPPGPAGPASVVPGPPGPTGPAGPTGPTGGVPEAPNDAQLYGRQSLAWAIVSAPVPAGTVMLFYQSAAPTGWTKLTTDNDKALRVVSGSGGVGGGSVAFSTAFARTATDNFTLATGHLPSHQHNMASVGTVLIIDAVGGGSYDYTPGTNLRVAASSYTTGSAGSGSAHNHTIDLRVQYLDLILASKN